MISHKKFILNVLDIHNIKYAVSALQATVGIRSARFLLIILQHLDRVHEVFSERFHNSQNEKDMNYKRSHGIKCLLFSFDEIHAGFQ